MPSRIQRVRTQMLRHFRTGSGHYKLVWTFEAIEDNDWEVVAPATISQVVVSICFFLLGRKGSDNQLQRPTRQLVRQ
jgi:hypothetical protein